MKSMTGYGSAQLEDGGEILRVEVASTNHRYLKMTLHLPDAFQPYEREVEKLIKDRISRGAVFLSATYQAARPGGDYAVDGSVIQSYKAQLKKLNKELGMDQDVTLGLLLSLPGAVVLKENGTASSRRWKAFRNVFKDAIENMAQMRQTEGGSLGKEIGGRARRLNTSLERVEKQASRIVSDYAARLKKRLKVLLNGSDAKMNDQDVLRETVLFAERSDVTEEVCRLRSHLEQLTQEITKDGEIGRKLDFITQEMLREVNTIGSKANDAPISKIVVNMKAEIDKIKEQVQNIE